MNSDGLVKVGFGGAHFDGYGVALGHFAGVRTQVVEADDSLVVGAVDNQLMEEGESNKLGTET